MTDDQKYLIDQLMRWFPSHPTDHGRLYGWTRTRDEDRRVLVGKKAQGTAKPYRPAADSDYLYHLTAMQDEPRGIGCYPLHTDGLTRFGVVDVDEKSERAERAVRFACTIARSCGCHPYLEQTTNGGWHIWLFTPSGSDGKAMLMALKALSQAVAAHGAPDETYPAAFNTAPRSGRYVNLPYRGAGREGDAFMYGATWLTDPFNSPKEPIAVCSLSEHLLETTMDSVRILASHYVPPPVTRKQRESAEQAQEYARDGKLFGRVCDALRTQPPSKGNRHDAILAASGVGKRQNVAESTIIRELQGVTDAWGQEPGRDWNAEVERAVKATLSSNQPTTGLNTLIRLGLQL